MKKAIYLSSCLILIFGCTLADTVVDIVDNEPIRITGFKPETAIIKANSLKTISVTFSRPPDRTLAEEAFTFTIEGKESAGIFSWMGNTMIFTPFIPWKEGVKYEFKVLSSVEDSMGHSLNSNFSHQFTTRIEQIHPVITAFTPAMEELTDNVRPNIAFDFSEPMDVSSVADSFAINPDTPGLIQWDSTGQSFTYTLTKKLEWQTWYTISIATDATDLQRNPLSEVWTARFFTGTDSVKPELLSFKTSNAAANQMTWNNPEDDNLILNSDWETDWPIILVFSEAMNKDTISAGFTISPSISWKDEWQNSDTELVISTDSGLKWGETYALRFSDEITDVQGNALLQERYLILRVDGSGTRPPKVLALALYTDLANATNAILPKPYDGISLAAFITPPGSVSTGNTVLDIFFELADGANINPITLAENVLISAGGVSSFILVSVAIADNTFIPPNITTKPFGPTIPTANYNTWGRFIVYIDNNDANNTGILTITVDSNLTDTDGRKMENDWVMPITITD